MRGEIAALDRYRATESFGLILLIGHSENLQCMHAPLTGQTNSFDEQTGGRTASIASLSRPASSCGLGAAASDWSSAGR